MIYPIRILKMLSGEILISGIGETGDSSKVYTLERPMLIVMISSLGKNKEPRNSIYLNNWIDFSKDEMFIVPKNFVVCSSLPDEEITKDYNEAKIKFDMMAAEDELHKSNGDFVDEGEDNNDSDDDEME